MLNAEVVMQDFDLTIKAAFWDHWRHGTTTRWTKISLPKDFLVGPILQRLFLWGYSLGSIQFQLGILWGEIPWLEKNTKSSNQASIDWSFTELDRRQQRLRGLPHLTSFDLMLDMFWHIFFSKGRVLKMNHGVESDSTLLNKMYGFSGCFFYQTTRHLQVWPFDPEHVLPLFAWFVLLSVCSSKFRKNFGAQIWPRNDRNARCCIWSMSVPMIIRWQFRVSSFHKSHVETIVETILLISIIRLMGK